MLFMLMFAAAPMHTRLVTENGPVHVAIPPRAAKVTVVYVHGFWTNVDDAWVHHRLNEQLALPDAVVIAPEAPSGPGQAVRWPSLSALLAEVEARIGKPLPNDVIAIGHSGAYRTVGAWVDEPRLKHVVLLDAFYGGAAPWERLLSNGGGLHVVARATAAKSKPFCAKHSEVVCEDSPLSHMGIVTSGRVMPRVLREVVRVRTPDA
ncbi:MAG: hypothetical protein JNK82_01040 [Myxococcaceae bacterium]|nr:hypothetical protein [Myxococcaceae bacterium]